MLEDRYASCDQGAEHLDNKAEEHKNGHTRSREAKSRRPYGVFQLGRSRGKARIDPNTFALSARRSTT